MDWSKIKNLKGWLDDALHGRLQSIAIGVYVDRVLWRFEIDRYKGMLTISAGPFFVEFGG